MKITGSYEFDSPAIKVWNVLTDPKDLQRCIPGCEELKPQGQDEYHAVLTVGVGPIRGKYNAKIQMKDQVPHQTYRLVVESTGSSGFLNAEALITLVEQDGRTTVQVESDSQAGRPIARLGQRMMGSVAKSMMDRFFGCLRESTG